MAAASLSLSSRANGAAPNGMQQQTRTAGMLEQLVDSYPAQDLTSLGVARARRLGHFVLQGCMLFVYTMLVQQRWRMSGCCVRVCVGSVWLAGIR